MARSSSRRGRIGCECRRRNLRKPLKRPLKPVPESHPPGIRVASAGARRVKSRLDGEAREKTCRGEVPQEETDRELAYLEQRQEAMAMAEVSRISMRLGQRTNINPHGHRIMGQPVPQTAPSSSRSIGLKAKAPEPVARRMRRPIKGGTNAALSWYVCMYSIGVRWQSLSWSCVRTLLIRCGAAS